MLWPILLLLEAISGFGSSRTNSWPLLSSSLTSLSLSSESCLTSLLTSYSNFMLSDVDIFEQSLASCLNAISVRAEEEEGDELYV